MKFTQIAATTASLLASTVTAQAPNTISQYNPDVQSMSLNGTFYVVPIARSAVEKAIAPQKVLPLPNDKTIFPDGFPAGSHPVLIRSGYGNDIRQKVGGVQLQIKSLLTAEVVVPFVDYFNDKKTPLAYSLGNFIGGVNGMDLTAVVPVLVGSAEGSKISVASFDPNDRAYNILAGPTYASTVKQVIVPNPISGPGILPEAIDTLFYEQASGTGATAHAFHYMLNQPIIVPTQPGQCRRTAYYFNDTFADPQLGRGTVQLSSPAVSPALVGGANTAATFKGVSAYAVTGQLVAYNVEECHAAVQHVDPAASK